MDKSEWKVIRVNEVDAESRVNVASKPSQPQNKSRVNEVDYKDNKDIKDNKIKVAEQSSAGIVKLINLFKDISPTNYSKWFNNTTYRNSAKNLLKKYPFEKLEILIRDILPEINIMSFVAKDCKAFNPYELEKNFDKIVAKIKELQLKRSDKKVITI